MNVVISAQKTLHNYQMRALFALDTISAWCVFPLERMPQNQQFSAPFAIFAT